MTVFLTKPSTETHKRPFAARHGVSMVAALALLALPIHSAFAVTQVRNVDEPGRIPYQSTLTGKPGAIFQFFFPLCRRATVSSSSTSAGTSISLGPDQPGGGGNSVRHRWRFGLLRYRH
jgi:hypothetical protein